MDGEVQMKARALGFMAVTTAIVAVGALVNGSAAASAACSPGQICLWSGTDYTGQMVALSPEHPWQDCIQAAALGLPAIRSAQKDDVACQFQASLHSDGGCGQATEPMFVQDDTPNINPPALSLQEITIPC
jgi:Peptidase inhibitor family I36